MPATDTIELPEVVVTPQPADPSTAGKGGSPDPGVALAPGGIWDKLTAHVAANGKGEAPATAAIPQKGEPGTSLWSKLAESLKEPSAAADIPPARAMPDIPAAQVTADIPPAPPSRPLEAGATPDIPPPAVPRPDLAGEAAAPIPLPATAPADIPSAEIKPVPPEEPSPAGLITEEDQVRDPAAFSQKLKAAGTAVGGDIADIGKGLLETAKIPGEVYKTGVPGSPEMAQQAREFATTFGIPGGAPKGALASGLSLRGLREGAKDFGRDVQIKVSPMVAGSEPAMASSTDFANKLRSARFSRTRFDDMFRKYNEADQTAMWEAADSASVAEQAVGPGAGDRYLKTLPREQETAIRDMDAYGQDLWDRGRAAGIIDESAERLPFYATRAILDIGSDGAKRLAGGGAVAGARPLDQLGVNLRTRGTQRRSFLTAEESEAAAQTRYGPTAKITRNIRATPWAMERFEQAIAGRELVNDIEAIGKAAGKQTVSNTQQPGFFTIDNAALKRFTPRLHTDAGGKRVPVRDAEGNIVMDRVPIYVAREFEGPLRAVLSTGQPGTIHSALMALKAGSMSLIMNSPLIHNMVEFGRAFPAMPGKVASFGVYRDGSRFLQDAAQMKDAVEHGLVPIGHRGYIQDITGIAEEPVLEPGRSLTAKALGGGVGMVSPRAGQAVKRGIDYAGQIWHEKLLWDQVGKLQAGLYVNFRNRMLKDGIPAAQAKRTAGHLANRFAGALPNEAMSEGARKLANFVMFSRAFTLGNLGVMKDMVNGLPRNIRAQIDRDLGTVTANPAFRTAAARRAIGVVMTDMALFIAGNAILEGGIQYLTKQQDLGEIEKGYVRRLQNLLQRTREHWTDVLNPIDDLMSLTPGAEHEPGHENRVLLTHLTDGTAIYLRSPLGKIGEEFYNWFAQPIQQWKNKEGTLVKPLLNLLANDDGFGRKVYSPQATGIRGMVSNLGRIVGSFVMDQTPQTQIKGAVHAFTDPDPERRHLAAAQAVAPILGGFTISRGYPGGEVAGEIAHAKAGLRETESELWPVVDDMIRAGRLDDAKAEMKKAGIPLGLQRWRIRVIQHPSSRGGPRQEKGVRQWLQTHPEEQRRLDILKQQQQGAPTAPSRPLPLLDKGKPPPSIEQRQRDRLKAAGKIGELNTERWKANRRGDLTKFAALGKDLAEAHATYRELGGVA